MLISSILYLQILLLTRSTLRINSANTLLYANKISKARLPSTKNQTFHQTKR